MKNNFITKVVLIAGAAVLLSACSSDSSSVSSSTENVEIFTASSNPIVQTGFAFPDVQLTEDSSVGTVSQPTGDLPLFSARRTVASGTGEVVVFGDPVQLKYNMYSWSSGELIESSDSFDEAIIIRAGVAEGVPAYLSNTVLGRSKGETVQIVYAAGMDDLPDYLDNEDAYVMVLQVL